MEKIYSRYPIYEFEIEFIKPVKLDIFYKELSDALMVFQNTDVPIGKTEAANVVEQYQNLLGIRVSGNLDSRNVISIEPQHIIKFIPNKYAVTDKADGERYFLFITKNNNTYLMSSNLAIKKINVVVQQKCSNIILDGEYIDTTSGSIFMAFDVVYADGIDYRHNTKYNLSDRIDVLEKIIDQCFGTLIHLLIIQMLIKI